jgi:uncharacterized RDD family membrane protein YckC
MHNSDKVLSTQEVKKILIDDPIAVVGASEKNPKSSSSIATSFQRFSARLIDLSFVFFVSICLSVLFIFTYLVTIDFNTLEQTSLNCSNLSYQELQSKEICNDFIQRVESSIFWLFIILFVFYIMYFVLMPKTKLKSTFGKLAMKLRIVDDKLQNKVTLIQLFTREVFWILFWFFIFFSPIFPTFAQISTNIILIFLLVNSIKISFSQDKIGFNDTLSNTRTIKL